MSHDAIVMLKEDHKRVKALIREFRRPSTTPTRKEMIVERLIELLTVHTFLEDEVMYPRVRQLLPDLDDAVLTMSEEHHVTELLLVELAGMTRADERFLAKAGVLVELVRHHIREEEDEWFPQMRQRLSRPQLREIGTDLVAAKRRAPHRPGRDEATTSTLDAALA